MTQDDLIAQQDDLRTKRMFVGFIGNILGVDGDHAGSDNSVLNRPAQYQIIGSGGVAVEGLPVSTAQPAISKISPIMMVGVGLMLFFLVQEIK